MFESKYGRLKNLHEHLSDDFHKLQQKFESVCILLDIGFYGDADYPFATFIDKEKIRKGK